MYLRAGVSRLIPQRAVSFSRMDALFAIQCSFICEHISPIGSTLHSVEALASESRGHQVVPRASESFRVLVGPGNFRLAVHHVSKLHSLTIYFWAHQAHLDLPHPSPGAHGIPHILLRGRSAHQTWVRIQSSHEILGSTSKTHIKI